MRTDYVLFYKGNHTDNDKYIRYCESKLKNGGIKMKFTEKELYLLSCGVIQLIEDASQAKKLLHAGSTAGKTAIEEYTKELQELNSKVCSMMND